jgi:hypothetical protein
MHDMTTPLAAIGGAQRPDPFLLLSIPRERLNSIVMIADFSSNLLTQVKQENVWIAVRCVHFDSPRCLLEPQCLETGLDG